MLEQYAIYVRDLQQQKKKRQVLLNSLPGCHRITTATVNTGNQQKPVREIAKVSEIKASEMILQIAFTLQACDRQFTFKKVIREKERRTKRLQFAFDHAH